MVGEFKAKLLHTLCVQSILGAPGRRRRAQPVAEMAAEPQDIKSRLAGVPVYTVANKKNEFVLVSGEVRASLSLGSCSRAWFTPQYESHTLALRARLLPVKP